MRYNIDSGDNRFAPNFTDAELRSASSGSLRDIDANVLGMATTVRTLVGDTSIRVNSLIRNYIPAGGVQNSAHLRGNAIDLGMTPTQIKKFKAELPLFMDIWGGKLGGIGFYSWGVHLDTEHENATKYWQLSGQNKDYLLRVWGQKNPFILSDWDGLPSQSDIEETDDETVHGVSPFVTVTIISIIIYLFAK